MQSLTFTTSVVSEKIQNLNVFDKPRYLSNQKQVNYLPWIHISSTKNILNDLFLMYVGTIIIIIIYPLTVRVVGVPQMISQPAFSIFPCSPLPSGTCRTQGLSISWCCLPISSSSLYLQVSHFTSHYTTKSWFFSLFIFCGHLTQEPASSRVPYFILRAYTGTMC